MKQGDRGEYVKVWQRCLNMFAPDLGALLAVDGNCGPLTLARSMAFFAEPELGIALTGDQIPDPLIRSVILEQAAEFARWGLPRI